MYDIRQFRPTLYIVVLLGITGFALAVRAPGLWLLSVVAMFFNAWLVRTNRFAPLPRMIANAATLLAFLWTFLSVRNAGTMPIIGIGYFLVILQLVKLYEQRANRDYAQLLVLSLLLMVAAAISTASLAFGLLFFCYLFLSLYCCLLFHLKVEADNARALMMFADQRTNPTTIRQDQRFLSRSMRRLTGTVSAVAICFAVVVFLFFPRGTGAGLLGPLQYQRGQPMTGFSDQMGYNQVARISQNTERIAHVWVWEDEQPVRGGILLLRGLALDRYTGKGADGVPAWQWLRGDPSSRFSPEPELTRDVNPGNPWQIDSRPLGPRIRQHWSFDRPTGSNVIFGIGGIQSIVTARDLRLRYAPRSQTLVAAEPIDRPLEYTVVSSGIVTEPSAELQELMNQRYERRRSMRWWSRYRGEEAPPPPATQPASATQPYYPIDPRIGQFAARPEVSGSNDNGPLVAQRPKGDRTHPLDLEIARNIETYLQREFAYTLDLTDTRRVNDDEDPLVGFLYDFQRGHCEYFAGAMALMCQDLGMQARVVIGFKTDEFNELGGYYLVRQSHAHAWVEVLGHDGIWHTFDPTSANDPRFAGGSSTWQRVKHLIDYLEHKWASSVVAYDSDSRANLITRVDQQLTETVISGNQWFHNLKSWLDEKLFWRVSSGLLGLLMWCLAGGLLVAIGWFLWERWKLRRKAARMGIDILPTSDQLRLVRQLGFYDDLIRLLARHNIERPAHLTPREWSESLTWLPTEAFVTIRRLTDLFYRIRYGDARLQPAQRRRLQAVLTRISNALSSAQGTA